MSMERLKGLGLAVGTTALAALAGAAASVQAKDFYASLNRPTWAPPAAVFGPVWTVLYAMMAVAAWLVWRDRHLAGAATALRLHVAQLVANGLWSWLFFAWKRGAGATAEIVVLWLLVAATVLAFARVRRAAGWLLVPYLTWVTFAVALCTATWRLNPGVL